MAEARAHRERLLASAGWRRVPAGGAAMPPHGAATVDAQMTPLVAPARAATASSAAGVGAAPEAGGAHSAAPAQAETPQDSGPDSPSAIAASAAETTQKPTEPAAQSGPVTQSANAPAGVLLSSSATAPVPLRPPTRPGGPGMVTKSAIKRRRIGSASRVRWNLPELSDGVDGVHGQPTASSGEATWVPYWSQRTPQPAAAAAPAAAPVQQSAAAAPAVAPLSLAAPFTAPSGGHAADVATRAAAPGSTPPPAVSGNATPACGPQTPEQVVAVPLQRQRPAVMYLYGATMGGQGAGDGRGQLPAAAGTGLAARAACAVLPGGHWGRRQPLPGPPPTRWVLPLRPRYPPAPPAGPQQHALEDGVARAAEPTAAVAELTVAAAESQAAAAGSPAAAAASTVAATEPTVAAAESPSAAAVSTATTAKPTAEGPASSQIEAAPVPLATCGEEMQPMPAGADPQADEAEAATPLLPEVERLTPVPTIPAAEPSSAQAASAPALPMGLRTMLYGATGPAPAEGERDAAPTPQSSTSVVVPEEAAREAPAAAASTRAPKERSLRMLADVLPQAPLPPRWRQVFVAPAGGEQRTGAAVAQRSAQQAGPTAYAAARSSVGADAQAAAAAADAAAELLGDIAGTPAARGAGARASSVALAGGNGSTADGYAAAAGRVHAAWPQSAIAPLGFDISTADIETTQQAQQQPSQRRTLEPNRNTASAAPREAGGQTQGEGEARDGNACSDGETDDGSDIDPAALAAEQLPLLDLRDAASTVAGSLTRARVQAFLAALQAASGTPCGRGRWVWREDVLALMWDAPESVASCMLPLLCDVRVGGHVVLRKKEQPGRGRRRFLYRLVRLPGTAADAALVYTGPMPSGEAQGVDAAPDGAARPPLTTHGSVRPASSTGGGSGLAGHAGHAWQGAQAPYAVLPQPPAELPLPLLLSRLHEARASADAARCSDAAREAHAPLQGEAEVEAVAGPEAEPADIQDAWAALAPATGMAEAEVGGVATGGEEAVSQADAMQLPELDMSRLPLYVNPWSATAALPQLLQVLQRLCSGGRCATRADILAEMGYTSASLAGLLPRLRNVRVGGYVVRAEPRRCASRGHAYYPLLEYRVQRIEGTPQGAPLVYTGPLPLELRARARPTHAHVLGGGLRPVPAQVHFTGNQFRSIGLGGFQYGGPFAQNRAWDTGVRGSATWRRGTGIGSLHHVVAPAAGGAYGGGNAGWEDTLPHGKRRRLQPADAGDARLAPLLQPPPPPPPAGRWAEQLAQVPSLPRMVARPQETGKVGEQEQGQEEPLQGAVEAAAAAEAAATAAAAAAAAALEDTQWSLQAAGGAGYGAAAPLVEQRGAQAEAVRDWAVPWRYAPVCVGGTYTGAGAAAGPVPDPPPPPLPATQGREDYPGLHPSPRVSIVPEGGPAVPATLHYGNGPQAAPGAPQLGPLVLDPRLPGTPPAPAGVASAGNQLSLNLGVALLQQLRQRQQAGLLLRALAQRLAVPPAVPLPDSSWRPASSPAPLHGGHDTTGGAAAAGPLTTAAAGPSTTAAATATTVPSSSLHGTLPLGPGSLAAGHPVGASGAAPVVTHSSAAAPVADSGLTEQAAAQKALDILLELQGGPPQHPPEL